MISRASARCQPPGLISITEDHGRSQRRSQHADWAWSGVRDDFNLKKPTSMSPETRFCMPNVPSPAAHTAELGLEPQPRWQGLRKVPHPSSLLLAELSMRPSGLIRSWCRRQTRLAPVRAKRPQSQASLPAIGPPITSHRQLLSADLHVPGSPALHAAKPIWVGSGGRQAPAAGASPQIRPILARQGRHGTPGHQSRRPAR